jgi:hypothetical protein
MKKPATKADLMPPFRIIGEAGWVEALQKLLVDYGIESSKRVPEEVVEKRERELGIQIPYSLRIFLTEFGNIDFDCFCLYPLSSIKPVTNIWFRDFLALEEQYFGHFFSDNRRTRLSASSICLSSNGRMRVPAR